MRRGVKGVAVHGDARPVGQRHENEDDRDWVAPRDRSPDSLSDGRHERDTPRRQGRTPRQPASPNSDDFYESADASGFDPEDRRSVMPPSVAQRVSQPTAISAQRRQRDAYNYGIGAGEPPRSRRQSELAWSPVRHQRRVQPRYVPEMSPQVAAELQTDSEPDVESEADSIATYSSPRRDNIGGPRDVGAEADDEAPRVSRRKRLTDGPRTERRRPSRRENSGNELLDSPFDYDSKDNREIVRHNQASAVLLTDDGSENDPLHIVPPQRRLSNLDNDLSSFTNLQRPTRQPHRSPETNHRASQSRKGPSSRSSRASSRRPSQVNGAIFNTPKLPKKTSTHQAQGTMQRASEPPTEGNECVICMRDVSARKVAHLSCDHYMCHKCLKRLFTLSVTDPAHMPPKCCTKDHIPLKHVDRLFDPRFKSQWNKKYVEYTTKNRLYCPAKRCGHFIKPSRIKVDNGREYARCGRCETKVCAKCNNRWHKTVYCPSDEEMNQFLDAAQKAGWQRCYQCRAMVELKEGCNHMKCRCGGEFCMLCGNKWKSCDCPWFSDEAIAADRERQLYEPPPPLRGEIDDIFHDNGPPMPAELRDMPFEHGFAALPHRPRPQTYPDESTFRRLQEQGEPSMARRARTFGPLEENYSTTGHDMYGGDFGEVVGIGNASGHHMNNHYVRRGGRSVVTAPVGSPPMSYDRGGYVSEISRARGPRESSLERRLADRLSERPQNASNDPMYPASGPHIGPPPPPPVMMQQRAPMYNYGGMPSHSAMNPSPNMPMAMQGYPPYANGSADLRYAAMHPTPGSSPHGYELRETEDGLEVVHTPRHRRRGQHRERAASVTGPMVTHGSPFPSSSASATGGMVKSSSLAGLTGPGKGMDRVEEWSYFVPDYTQSPSLVGSER